MAKGWFLYLIECKGDKHYTGITTDLDARFKKHLAGKGAIYTRLNPPIKMLAAHPFPNQSEATKAEIAFKKLKLPQKLEQIKSWEITQNLPKTTPT